ncbi:hypothetical protein NDU88_011402 [Pleurodeles waltl]|uniref:Uncharacterized protein n=1 Tax=Pleurodeles waltl TaxID=8319 RepID=A0AAV7Q0Q4_PLEWA|nr:hypothetical protein NDU88_011402 [Pleurodeles waltl]
MLRQGQAPTGTPRPAAVGLQDNYGGRGGGTSGHEMVGGAAAEKSGRSPVLRRPPPSTCAVPTLKGRRHKLRMACPAATRSESKAPPLLYSSKRERRHTCGYLNFNQTLS